MKIEWEDSSDGNSTKTEFSLRILIGDEHGHNEDLHTTWITIAIKRHEDSDKSIWTRWAVYINSKYKTTLCADSLEEAKHISLSYAGEGIETWFVDLLHTKE
jgi:hypothetical protein